MKERPIPFSAPMVRARLAGTKTQTRRVMQMHPSAIGCCCGGTAARWVAEGDRWHCGTCGGGGRLTPKDVEYVRCPYGQPGDRLWVRESWRAPLAYELTPPRDIPPGTPITYQADGAGTLPHINAGKLRPGMFMPRWASRTILDVTAVRVERLQDISREDAMAEGIVLQPDGGYGLADTTHYHATDPRHSYWSLWEAINGPGSVEANPWVWAVTFATASPTT